MLAKEDDKLHGKVDHPFPMNYRPEVNVSNELRPELVHYCQHLIEILHWACKLGHVDVVFEVSLLSAYNALL